MQNINYTTTCPTSYPLFNPTSYLVQNRILEGGISSESLLDMYVINPFYVESENPPLRLDFVPFYVHLLPIVCCLTVTYHIKRVLKHPKTKNSSKKNHSIKLYQHMDKYVALECCYWHHVILYNSINNNYTTTCPISYPLFNTTLYIGQHSILKPGISSKYL